MTELGTFGFYNIKYLNNKGEVVLKLDNSVFHDMEEAKLYAEAKVPRLSAYGVVSFLIEISNEN